MTRPRLKQLAQDGATDGEVIAWNNAGGVWEPQTNSASLVVTQVTATAVDPITSATDVLIVGMTQTPGAGNYKISFSTSAHLGANKSEADFSVYVNAVKQAASVRTIGRGTGGTAAHIHSVAIAEYYVAAVGGGEAIEIRASVSAGTLEVFERNFTLTKV